MNQIVQDWVAGFGVSPDYIQLLSLTILTLGIGLIAYLSNLIGKKILIKIVVLAVRRSRTDWDDLLLKQKFFDRLSHLIPALVIYYLSDLTGPWQQFLQKASVLYMLMAGMSTFSSFLDAVNDIYLKFKISSQRPIKGYLQVVKIVSAVFVVLLIIAISINRNPLVLLGGLGAMTAVLLLIFKDSILGLIAGIQLSMNDMVRIGDWVEMPQYNADGDVIDISLHTVKIQNWDKTISSIPTYAFISGSFKNWRGMTESGGRRIKRAIHIDMSSIRFCTPEMLKRYERFQFLKEYIITKQTETTEFNANNDIDASELLNGRNLTNVGTFRAYLVAYLKNHPKIDKNMTFLVRQLTPSENGLPIELYVFSNDQNWVNYEGIMSDIFDHILAVVPMFDLRVFQRPSGNDIRKIRQLA